MEKFSKKDWVWKERDKNFYTTIREDVLPEELKDIVEFIELRIKIKDKEE